jgi:hypothetical protein
MQARKAVLILETEIIIALSIQAALQGLYEQPVIVLTSAGDFAKNQMSWDKLDFAILEVHQKKHDHLDLIRSAIDHQALILGLTTDNRLENGMPEFPGMPILTKPVPDSILLEAVQTLLKPRPDQNE